MELMDLLITQWKDLNKEKNSVNLIVHKNKSHSFYTGYIFLRNSDYRTPPEIQKIKSEGIGIIEMAGEAILPVPSGTQEEVGWKWNMIKNNGLYVIKQIISGNNPVKNINDLKDFVNNSLKEAKK